MNEKVIEGLRWHLTGAYKCVYAETGCPYVDDCRFEDYGALARDALKAIEAHLLTKEDFENADKYGWLPVWTQTTTDLYCECVTISCLDDDNEYDYKHRRWVGKPTEEQLNSEWEDES